MTSEQIKAKLAFFLNDQFDRAILLDINHMTGTFTAKSIARDKVYSGAFGITDNNFVYVKA